MSAPKPNRRTFLKMTAGVMGASVLAACAPQAPAQPAPAAQAPEATKAPEAAAEPTKASEPTKAEAPAPSEAGSAWQGASLTGKTFVMWGLDFAPHVEKYKMIAAAFEEKTGAKGSVEPQQWPVDPKILAGLAAGTAPDTCCYMGKGLGPLVRENALVPFDDVVFKAVGIDPSKWFTPGGILPYKHQGHYYGVPVEDNQVASFLLAREDWIKEAGVEKLWPALRGGDPWFADYAELWEFSKKQMVKDSGGNVTRWGYSGIGWELQQFGGIARMLGLKWWDNDQKKFSMDSDGAIQAIQIQVGDPVESGIETALPQSAQDAFAQGKVAVARGNMGIFPEAEKNNIPVTGAIAPPLKKGDKPLFTGEGGWGFILIKGSKNADTALELARFMTTAEGNGIWTDIYGGILPPVYAVRDLPFWKEAKTKGTQIVKSWFPAQELTEYYPEGLENVGPYETAYAQITGTIRSGEAKPKEAAQQLQKLFTENWDKWTKGE